MHRKSWRSGEDPCCLAGRIRRILRFSTLLGCGEHYRSFLPPVGGCSPVFLPPTRTWQAQIQVLWGLPMPKRRQASPCTSAKTIHHRSPQVNRIPFAVGVSAVPGVNATTALHRRFSAAEPPRSGKKPSPLCAGRPTAFDQFPAGGAAGASRPRLQWLRHRGRAREGP